MKIFEDLVIWYEDLMWKYGPERKLLVKNKLRLHAEAMKNGHNSPYTHPEEYDLMVGKRIDKY